MYKVKVVGTYIARSGVMDKEKIKKNYEIEGNIPTLTAPLSVVKNKLLGPALSAKYPDYVTFLTYHIVKIEPLTEEAKAKMGKLEVMYMDRPSLIALIKELALPVKHEYYPSLFRLREAVEYAKEDPEGYTRQFAIREPDLRLDLEMAQCNPELFKSEDAGFVASVSLPSDSFRPKAAKPEVHARQVGDRVQGMAAEMVREKELAPLDASEDNGTVGIGDL